MKIKSIASYLVPGDQRPAAWCLRKTYVFVRVETEDGLVGWGEVYTFAHRERALVEHVRSLAAHLAGRDVCDIKSFNHFVFNGYGEQRIGIDVHAAASGIEIALWDLMGKSLAVPVYKLLGGTCHGSLPCYANIWSQNVLSGEALAEKAVEQVGAGFRTLKFYPFMAGVSVADGAEKVRLVREAVGPEVQLAVDLRRNSNPVEAREICDRLQAYNLCWIEDPFAPVNPDAMRILRDHVRQPLMTGETLAGKNGFRELLDKQAVSYINPDVCACGGILELREIAALAESQLIAVSPHNYNSMTVGLAATLQAAAGMPNLLLCEYFPEVSADLDDLCNGRPEPVDGMFELPQSPGIGVSFNDAKMERYRIAT